MAYNLLIETFAEYGTAMCFLILRFFARIKTVGLHGLGIGDAFAGAAMVFYSLMTAGIYFIEGYGSSIGLDPSTALDVQDSKIPDLVVGSKFAFMNWIWYLCFIWCLKGVLLNLFYKIGTGLPHHEKVALAMSGFTFATWLACILTHLCICLPPQRSWQIKPYPGDNCTIRRPNYIVIATMNCITDFGIMLIPMPLLLKVRVHWTRKALLILMFSGGFFVMIATILRSYYSLRSLSDVATALGWADREGFVATITVCLPGIKPLFSKQVWFPDSTNNSHPGASSHTGNRFSTGLDKSKDASNMSSQDPMDRYFEMTAKNTWRHHKGRRLSSEASDEEVIINDIEGSRATEDLGDDIRVTREYRVSRETTRT